MRGCILVIDDDEGVRLTLRHVLEANGYGVMLAVNGPQALEIAQDLRPQLILTDLIMPGTDGPELVRILKGRWPATPLIAISGGARLGMANVLQQALDAGADHGLSKPFLLDELSTLISACLSKDGSGRNEMPHAG